MWIAFFKPKKKGKEEIIMEKMKIGLMVGLMVGLITLMASPVFAREISFKGAGTALWVFIIIGAMVVLLQLVPAMILFFSFIGTVTTMGFKRAKKAEEEVVLPGAEPVRVKK
jgi:hypothetical protein